VILNIFPYNNGHIMVVPNAHIASLGDLNPIELQDLFQTVQLSESVIKKVYNPDGINVGINLGKAAGAGVDDHLHVHILPRWFGDTNFMSSVSATRVVPEDFDITAKKMKECFLDGN
jgi:ATP adenylyltransferase